LEERIEADIQLGGHAALVGELEALVIEQPLRELLRGQLIPARYRSGRQVEALAQYQAARRMLADELGLEPSPELQELERMVLSRRLTGFGSNCCPRISRDGTRILLAAPGPGPGVRVTTATVASDGSGLTPIPLPDATSTSVPDGAKILFRRPPHCTGRRTLDSPHRRYPPDESVPGREGPLRHLNYGSLPTSRRRRLWLLQ
jgi:hypothetical protein